MTIGQMLLPEFDQEMANTRKILELVPDDKLDWKIHEKSNTISWLANHLSDIPGWTIATIHQDEWDEGKAEKPEITHSREAYLKTFDKNVAEARDALENVDDQTIMKNWRFLYNGQEIFTLPKLAVIRTWVINHIIHHRGIMTVYYRVNEIPVPGMYGPSADDQIM